jgi:hypothetical protein
VFEDSRLQALQDHVVGPLDLSIGSWVSDGGPIHTDVAIIAELDELFSTELGAFVGDDRVGDPEAIDDAGEERYNFLRVNDCDWVSLDPL